MKALSAFIVGLSIGFSADAWSMGSSRSEKAAIEAQNDLGQKGRIPAQVETGLSPETQMYFQDAARQIESTIPAGTEPR